VRNEFSRFTVSDLCKQLDPVVRLDTLPRGIPFVIVDAMVLKVREEGHVPARGVLL
jgi:transposase-like protein